MLLEDSRLSRWNPSTRLAAWAASLAMLLAGGSRAQDPGLPPPSSDAPVTKTPAEPPASEQPDGRAIVTEMLQRLGDLSAVRSLRHTTTIPAELAASIEVPQLLQLSWLRADTVELRPTGPKSTSTWGVMWEGIGWSTEDGGTTWMIEQQTEYLNALRWFSPMSVLLDLQAAPSLMTHAGREVVNGRDCHRVTVNRPHLGDGAARFNLLIDAESYVLRRLDSYVPVVIEAWETVEGLHVITRASVSGNGARLETTYGDYSLNSAAESIRVMPDAVHAMWMKDHKLDPRRWQGRAAISTVHRGLGRLAQVGPIATTATLPENWREVLSIKPEDVGADREVGIGLNPMEFLRTLGEWVVTEVELDEEEGEEPIVVVWLEHPDDGLEVTLGLKTDGELLGIETEFFYLDVTEWREQDGVRVISKAVWGDMWIEDEVNVEYRQVTFGNQGGTSSPPGGTPHGTAPTERPTTAPAKSGAAALVDRAFEQMGSTASLDAVTTLSHQFAPPAWFAARVRLTERVSIAARPPHGLLCATNDARLGSITQVYDGEISWMRWEGRGGWRRNEPDLFLTCEAALSPAAYLLSVRARQPTYTLVEAAGDDTTARVKAESGDFACTLLLDATSGRFAGIIDRSGHTLRLNEWAAPGDITWPVAATLELPRQEGGPVTFRYAGYEVNIVPAALFARPAEIR